MTAFASVDLPASATKARFKEPFVSEALNLKAAGIVPPGVYRGFTPTGLAGSIVDFDVDSASGDSVAVVETPQNFNMTVRSPGKVSVDMTGHTVFPVFIVLRTDYQISPSPLTGLTTSKLVVVDTPIDNLDPTKLHDGDVKLCRVTSFIATVPQLSLGVPADRQDNGGPLITATTGGGVPKAAFTQDIASGNLIIPTFAPVTTPTGLIVAFTTIPASSDVVAHAECATANLLGGSEGCQLSLSLDGGASIFLGPPSRENIGLGGIANQFVRGVFNGVAAGPHTIEVLAASTPTGGVANIFRGPTALGAMISPFSLTVEYLG